MENSVWKQFMWLLKQLKKGGNIKDLFIVGSLAGLIGAVFMDISGLFLWKNRKTEGLYGHLAGSMIMPAYKTKQRKNFIIGEIFHLSFASIIGILITHIFKLYGKKYYLLKGAVSGLALWGFFYNFGQKMNSYNAKPHLTRSGYASLWHHLLYGLVTSQVIMTLSDPSLFPEYNVTEPITEKEFAGEGKVTPIRNPLDYPRHI